MERNSLYLEKKAANLANALLFFIASSHHQRRADRLITFLDQIEFWDWEMDELLFSYANFAERSAAFNTEVPGEHAADKGLFVRKPHRRVSPWASLTAVLENPNNRRRIRVVAPPDALAATVQVWHTVLGAAEATVLASANLVDQANDAGAGYATNLSKYRKSPQSVSPSPPA